MALYVIEVDLTHTFTLEDSVKVEVDANNLAEAVEKAEEEAINKGKRPNSWDADYEGAEMDGYKVLKHDNAEESTPRCRHTPDLFPQLKASFTVRATEKQLIAAARA